MTIGIWCNRTDGLARVPPQKRQKQQDATPPIHHGARHRSCPTTTHPGAPPTRPRTHSCYTDSALHSSAESGVEESACSPFSCIQRALFAHSLRSKSSARLMLHVRRSLHRSACPIRRKLRGVKRIFEVGRARGQLFLWCSIDRWGQSCVVGSYSQSQPQGWI